MDVDSRVHQVQGPDVTLEAFRHLLFFLRFTRPHICMTNVLEKLLSPNPLQEMRNVADFEPWNLKGPKVPLRPIKTRICQTRLQQVIDDIQLWIKKVSKAF